MFCPPPVEVSLIRITGMGHSWSNGMYPTSSEIVEFFGLTNTTAVAQEASEDRQFTLSPNPARSTILVQLPSASRVQLVSSIGTIVSSAEYAGRFADIACSNLPGGLYFVRIQPLRGGEVLTKAVMVTGGR
ncbi:MAG: T9SS type A sorting domain-containing protein [Ignavibacteria bacterium]|nr:T9SS type A sorting domain-containing protein [Ignavibacteria bacterium]